MIFQAVPGDTVYMLCSSVLPVVPYEHRNILNQKSLDEVKVEMDVEKVNNLTGFAPIIFYYGTKSFCRLSKSHCAFLTLSSDESKCVSGRNPPVQIKF